MIPHEGNFVEWTNKTITNIIGETNEDQEDCVLVVSPGYTINDSRVITNSVGEDVLKTIETYMLGEEFVPLTGVIMSRVFEHLPIRELDWYLYSLFKCMKKGAPLILTVPDMDDALDRLRKEMSREHPDHFYFFKYCMCLYAEGNNIGDTHKWWTNEQTVKYVLEREGIFKIENLRRISVDTPYDVHLEITAGRL